MNLLAAVALKSLVESGRYKDGNGLYFYVRPTGQKGWVFRYQRDGKERDMGLGSYPEVSLAQARQAAEEVRQKLRAGDDPIAARKAEQAAKLQKIAQAEERSFRFVAERYIAKHEPTWKNAKHREQWRNTLATHVYPKIGMKDVAEINRSDVLAILEPIWTRIPETASRLRGRIETILDFAASEGLREAPNPARLADLRHALPNARKLKPVQHQPALPWRKLPDFMAELRKNRSVSALALQFLILTAKRTSEVTGAIWGEVNLEEAVWTIPPERMKVPVKHRVPLSPAALKILDQLKPERPDPRAYIFPGLRPGSQLSNMAMLELVRGIQGKASAAEGGGRPRWVDELGQPIVPHGFRSTFRQWVAEATPYPDAWAEAALAHTPKDKVVAAYQRSDLLDNRRELMKAWATYISQKLEDVNLLARQAS